MDNVITSLSTLGIGGLMAAAVVYMMWHNTTVTIPSLMQQHQVMQEAFLTSLKEIEVNCQASNEKMQNVWAEKVDRLTGKIDLVSQELRSLRDSRRI